ncbi:T9SS type A sorting domain-containing protein [uncultured Kordia sp.]|uniref:T9SS type A sorting domain-containing protein n=1 Tax=uncultured Kordia sp. TaxID=507699 RepID=UPI00260CD978|nr:T9SS type A sorting domain-containing protein [uncultured Kordia sp.]
MKKIVQLALIIFITCTTVCFSQVDLGDDITTCAGDTVILDATTQDASSYQWAKDGQILVNETNATLLVTESGLYEATALINGMPSADTVVVTINPIPNIGSISLYIIEDLTGTGFADFDLTTKIPQHISANSEITVTFYATQSDAETNSNPIVNPTNFQNTTNPQFIYMRAAYITTNCAAITSFQLEVINYIEVGCADPPVYTSYCYTDNDETKFTFRNTNGYTLRVEFIEGTVDTNFDTLRLYDSDNATTLLYEGIGNNGDLSGLTFESTANEVTIQASSNGAVSCNSDGLVRWLFVVSCVDVGQFGSINVRSFLDDNNNATYDDGESFFSSGYVTYEANINGTIETRVGNSNLNIYSYNASNTYDLTFSLWDDYINCYNITTTNINDISVAAGEVVIVDFPITVQQPCEDLAVSLVNDASPPRPGFTHTNRVFLRNRSASAIASGTIEVVIDDQLVFNGVTGINPNYIVTSTATGFMVDFVNLEAFEDESITFELLCPASVPLGELVTNTATYTTDMNDIVLTNNMSSLTETVVGSWDPNDIIESRGPEIIHPDFTSEDYLYYTIRFQNLGTAEAINVRIEETLNTQVDETTFQMIASSHAYQVRRTNDELIWNFDDINLPAEMFDAEGSNGFVHFKIKPKAGYAIGDIIPAQAGIYFDFNAPVITNNFLTEFIEPLSVNELLETQIKIYPNPVTDILYIKLDQSEVMNLQLVDIHGKQTLNKSTEGEQIELNISSLKSGIYFLKLNSDTTQFTKKIIVN